MAWLRVSDGADRSSAARSPEIMPSPFERTRQNWRMIDDKISREVGEADQPGGHGWTAGRVPSVPVPGYAAWVPIADDSSGKAAPFVDLPANFTGGVGRW